MKLEYQDCGTNIALFLDGEKEEIEQKHMSLWNHGATKSELEWVNEHRAYMWTTKQKLLKALVNANLFGLLGVLKTVEEYKGIKGGLLPKARELADVEFSGIEKVAKQFAKWNSAAIAEEFVVNYQGNSASPFERGQMLYHGTVQPS
ncbi:hypothetical protein CMI37_11835 [Candidatus Pacearchaeota archaeon]|nr:hypothetical protein [Candidatus Pacearchaeota archaeon]|tara:strand:- start:1696 stop:2136 length:441 start_codon:yes stop_codon:yes gene_type:complete